MSDDYDNENRPKYIALALVATLMFFMLANDGSAAEYYESTVQPNTVIIDGPITDTECARFENVLAGLDYTTTHVVIRSSGGRSSQGHCIARTIRRLGIATSTHFALSAGAVIWLGGVERTLGFAGIVAIHGAYINNPSGPRGLNAMESKVNATLLERLLTELGYAEPVRNLLVTTMLGPSDVWLSIHHLATHRQGEQDVPSGQ